MKVELSKNQKETVKKLIESIKQNQLVLETANNNLSLYAQSILDYKNLDTTKYELNEDLDLVLKKEDNTKK